MPGHVALMALGQDWMTENHQADLVTACCLTYDIASIDDPIRSLAQRGYDLIQSKSTEYDEMKCVIGTVIQWLSTQPNIKIHEATIKRLKTFDEQRRLPK
ncbi:MAG: hypothetical protein RL563_2696 [Pseudomonadota bacterium]